MTIPKVYPCLWFDGTAEQAAELYTSLFPDSQIYSVNRSASDNPSTPAGAVLTVEFTLAGQRFLGLNGGPMFHFTEAVSFTIECADQAEVDHYWDGLLAGGGEASQCGWLKDRFGLSWQVVPKALPELLNNPDRDAAGRAMKAMLGMSKLDIARLQDAFEGVGS